MYGCMFVCIGECVHVYVGECALTGAGVHIYMFGNYSLISIDLFSQTPNLPWCQQREFKLLSSRLGAASAAKEQS